MNKILQNLLDGNLRFVEGKQKFANLCKNRREDLVKGQNPDVIILSCSDSRVPVEHIFDQGIGHIFIIRVAGNVVGQTVLESIEYAIFNLKTPLLMVLGHSSCGAITTAIESFTQKRNVRSTIVSKIIPAIEVCNLNSETFQDDVVKKNVELNLEKIKKSSPLISNAVKDKKIELVSAFYDLKSGKVSIL